MRKNCPAWRDRVCTGLLDIWLLWLAASDFSEDNIRDKAQEPFLSLRPHTFLVEWVSSKLNDTQSRGDRIALFCVTTRDTIMYQSNRTFNIPPGQPPGHLNFWKISVQIPPSPSQIAVQMPPPRGNKQFYFI